MTTDLHFGIIVVYFIYGLAFFCMGLAVMMEARRSPLLAEARILWPLAFFGFSHGTHEWLEIALEVRRWFGYADPVSIPWVRVVLLVISFTSLALYGIQVLRPQDRFGLQTNFLLVLGLLGLYVLLVIAIGLRQPSSLEDWLKRADALARYTLAVPGAAMAALALNRQAQQALQTQAVGGRILAFSLRLAGIGFAVYSLTQVWVSPADIFPARYLNTATFLAWTGFPIQVVRAGMAVLVTFGLIRALQLVEDERQRQLAAAQDARLQALEQIRHELAEREALRRDLLRHTVAAQEEERARIARELHDETAQFLTALSLDLATLQKSTRSTSKAGLILERLQSMSRQMSQGIYRLVHDLRPAQLDDLGLVAALGYLADEAQRGGLPVKLIVEGDRQRLEPLVETVLFRIAQEALTNVTRHASASQAMISLSFETRQVRLALQDEGVGFNPDESLKPPHGWGLAGMRERAESVGGQFRIDSAPGRGTLVEVIVPLAESGRTAIEENANEYDSVNAG